MRRLFTTCSVAALLALTAVTALAQKYQFKSITFSGYSAPQAQFLAVAGLQKDAPLGQTDMQAAAQRLGDTGLFSDVSFHFDGQELHYDLTPAGKALPAAFDNFPWW